MHYTHGTIQVRYNTITVYYKYGTLLYHPYLEGVSLVDQVLLSFRRVVHFRRAGADQRVEERVETAVNVRL